jgi:predicted permease
VGVNGHTVGPGYFTTLGIILLKGRDFDETDRRDRPPVAIVNESLAHRLAPEDEVVGLRIKTSTETDAPWTTIVGVVSDIRQRGLRASTEPELFVPYAQNPWARSHLVVSCDVDPATLGAPIRELVWSLDPNLPIGSTQTMKEHAADTIAMPRLFAALFTLFASMAITLAAIGVYGIVLSLTEYRKREIGIRLALGADEQRILKWAVSSGMKWVGIGLALGLVVAFSLSRLFASLVFGMTITDPQTYVIAFTGFLFIALLAAYLPARSAARTDPAETLRTE